MQIDKARPIGRHGLTVTQMGFGGAPFGNWRDAVSDQNVRDTITAAHDAGIRYFDTAPMYGYGLSEIRYGNELTRYNRDEIVISSKVGQFLVPRPDAEPDPYFIDIPPFKTVFDYSRDAILQTIEGSLERLKTDRIDIIYIHDPDEGISIQPEFDPYGTSHFKEVMEQTYPLLDDLRSQQVIKALGVGMNQWQMLRDFANEADFDCFLLAGRYTLLEQESLRELLPLCKEKGIRIVVGGPYNSGILATGAVEDAYYNYAPAPPQMLDRVSRIEAVCARHDVPLAAAALQFPLGHPAVAAIIPGSRSPKEVEANTALFQHDIPADFWAELKHLALIDPRSPVPSAGD